MDKRKIGNLTVPEIGMGCMGFSHGYGELPSEDYSIEAIRGRREDVVLATKLFIGLHKYPHVVPIPGSKNQERILENLGASSVKLTDKEFMELENALAGLIIYGHRRDVNMGSEYMD